ncbi:MAG TPA: site-specific integrase, partial [Segetibacter sp.]
QDWDEGKREVKPTHPNSSLLNTFISDKLIEYQKFVIQRQVLKFPVTKQIVLQYLKSESSVDSFYNYATIVINTKLLEDGKPYSKDTKRRYRDEVKRMKEYKPALKFNEITPQWLNEYKVWMQNVYEKKDGNHLHKNSIWKALGFVRMVWNEAKKNKLIFSTESPFDTFNVGSYEENLENIKYLELHEVQMIEDTLIRKKEVMPDLTYRIGWRFLTMCVCGMRISDAMYLNAEYFNDAGDLKFKPYKTRRHDNNAQVPITTDRQRRYFEKSLQLPLPLTSHKSFRTTFNDHLKVLAAMAGVDINITSHWGRHTMGSFIVDADISTKAGMAILGVKSERVIKGYMHLKESKLKSEGDKLGGVM